MRKVLCAMLAAALVLAVLPVSEARAAGGPRKSGLFTYELKGNGTAVITGFDWEANGQNDVYVPNMLDGYTVTEIGDYAFSSSDETGFNQPPISRRSGRYTQRTSDYRLNKKLHGQPVGIFLPDTITTIGKKAFFFTKVTSVAIPSSVRLIGEAAFVGCYKLKQHIVKPGNSVYAVIDGVLYNKTDKELISYPGGRSGELDVPAGILSIGSYAFYGIEEDVRFPSSVNRIGKYAFAYSYIKGINHNILYVKYIDDYAFCCAQSLLYFEFPVVTHIGAYAFYYTSYSVTNAPVEEIGEHAFSMCSVPEPLNLSKWRVTSIPEGVFEGSYVWRNRYSHTYGNEIAIILPETVTSIGDYAFCGYSISYGGLDRDMITVCVTIPPNVKTIGKGAFSLYGDPNVYVGGVGKDICKIKVSFAKNSSLEVIGEEAFCGISFGNSPFVLPEGVISIGPRAFYGYDLPILSIPSSVKEIGADVCDRTITRIEAPTSSYAELYALENGMPLAIEEDTDWLLN